MITTKQPGFFYWVGTTPYVTLEEAQKADLKPLMPTDWATPHEAVIEWMLANAAALAKILSTTPRQRVRKQRCDKGVPRKAKVQEVKP